METYTEDVATSRELNVDLDNLEVAILCFNRPEELARALKSVRQYPFGSISVLDNGSDPPIPDSQVGLHSRSEQNLGPCEGRNRLARSSRSDYILFLDDDAILADNLDIPALLLKFEDDPDLVVIAGLFERSGGEIARHEFPLRSVRRVHQARPCGYFIEGACIVRRNMFVEIGGFDPDFFYGHEAADFALRSLKLGRRIRYEPDLCIIHLPSELGRTSTRRSYVRQLRNRRILAKRNLPRGISAVHSLIWFTKYFLDTAINCPRDLSKLVKAMSSKVVLRPEILPERVLSYGECLRAHRLGYRVFW